MAKQTLVIYHADCPDGFAAAYAAWLRFGDLADYLPAAHGAYPVLDVAGQDVYILDFSFPRAMLDAMRGEAASMTILDHHASAQADLAGFPGAIFDMSKCGARMAWEHFHPGTPVPRLIDFVEDRDIWVWRHEHSADFLAYLDTLPFEFLAWKPMFELSPDELAGILWQGGFMQLKFQSLADAQAREAEPVTLCGILGSKVNVGYLFSDTVGAALNERNQTFAMLWRIERGMLYVSLRAKKGAVDVLAMARRFGGVATTRLRHSSCR